MNQGSQSTRNGIGLASAGVFGLESVVATPNEFRHLVVGGRAAPFDLSDLFVASPGSVMAANSGCMYEKYPAEHDMHIQRFCVGPPVIRERISGPSAQG